MTGFQVPPGPSITDQLWAELLLQMDKSFTFREEGIAWNDHRRTAQEGHCLGLAKALSIIINPYNPDIDAVRREAMRRYNER